MSRNYPKVPVKPVVDTYFGVEVTDSYRYLEQRDSEETKVIVQAENAYTKAFFAAHPNFDLAAREAKLRAEKPLTDLTSVEEAGGKIAAVRALPGGLSEIVALNDDYSVHHVIANGSTFDNRMNIYGVYPCPAEAPIYAILGVLHGHPRCAVILWNDAEKKELACLDDLFGMTWTADGRYVLYDGAVVDTAHHRNINTVYRYDWQAAKREPVYEHPGDAVWIDVYEGPAGGILMDAMNTYVDIQVLWQDAEEHVTRLNDGVGTWKFIGTQGDKLYFTTNKEADFCKVVAIEKAQLNKVNCLLTDAVDIIPEKNCLLTDCFVTKAGLIAVYERDGCTEVQAYTMDGAMKQTIALPDRYGHAMFADAGAASQADTLYFSFQSFLMEKAVYGLDVNTLEVKCITKAPEQCDDLTVDQCFLPARDGQQIAVYLVRQKDLQPNGKVPTLIYGYGGYAASNNPTAIEYVTCYKLTEWARMGRMYAHAIIRGGLEYGKKWHEGAMFNQKKHAFTDFIDIAEYLVAQHWTCPEKIIATGLSNGGLLMTAITTMRPDLFGTVIASVPHTDMLRFRNDDRGMMYVTEYGDPLGDEETFKYMYSYSPYHNVKAGTVYPWVYVQTGEMDNNVPPYHGKKFAVRMQACADEKNPVLLTVLAHGSHDRGTGDEYFLNISQIQAFIELSLQAKDEASKA